MKLVRYFSTWFNSGEPTYLAGQCYPVTDETKHHVGMGAAELIDAPADADKADAAADKAEAKAAEAAAQAAAAREAAEAAAAAQALADEQAKVAGKEA